MNLLKTLVEALLAPDTSPFNRKESQQIENKVNEKYILLCNFRKLPLDDRNHQHNQYYEKIIQTWKFYCLYKL